MSIKAVIYDNLTPQQRFLATLEADARKDETEIDRLWRTCARKTYTQADATFSDRLNDFYSAALAVHADLMDKAVFYWFSRGNGNDETAQTFARRAIDIEAAWRDELAALGVEESVIDKIGPPRNCLLTHMLDAPYQPDPEDVKQQRAVIAELIQAN